MRAITTGTRSTETTTSKSQEGPKVSGSGRDRYRPPTARTATHGRPAGLALEFAWLVLAGVWVIWSSSTAYSFTPRHCPSGLVRGYNSRAMNKPISVYLMLCAFCLVLPVEPA